MEIDKVCSWYCGRD